MLIGRDGASTIGEDLTIFGDVTSKHALKATSVADRLSSVTALKLGATSQPRR